MRFYQVSFCTVESVIVVKKILVDPLYIGRHNRGTLNRDPAVYI